MLYLIASLIALLIGPLCYRFLASGTGLQKGLDGFIFVALGGLVLIHILPELLEHGGWLSLVFIVIGLWGPTASERLFHRYSEVTHNITLVLGVLGLLLHTLTDGGALVLAGQPENSSLLALGIILHRLPVGIAIWWLLKPQVGTKWASVVIGFMMLLTAIGYFVGEQLLTQLSLDNTVYLQAFVTGSILHVVLHQPHVQHHEDKKGRYEYHAGIGSLLGIGLLLVLLGMENISHDHDKHSHLLTEFWRWALTLSPVLLLAFISTTIFYSLGLRTNTNNPKSAWLQKLVGPEAIVITGIILGIDFLTVYFICIGALYWFLIHRNVMPVMPHSTSTSLWQFSFQHAVDQSAPWIILSLVLANLIGHPALPLQSPFSQITFLAILFVILRFERLGAAIFAVSIAYNNWSPQAVIFVLLAATLLPSSQLKKLGRFNSLIVFVILIISLSLSSLFEFKIGALFVLPDSLNLVSSITLGLLFTSSLLRQGPRNFLQPLIIKKPHKHH
ncbi:metal transporter [Parashewanella spongiae]|uniref:Metal transporter n=1 Tax=Parashewanella spongiae TaxID=342950 RepID=A0A3A6UB93_9GAMM|nr:metal transporter [Parashewanella spongiae]MCL1077136.1 metal transporter [Parashewanella spongiae]RJY18840.1 metal transporter [Parashewanella spongiae]